MTDRVSAFIVTLEKDTREDDASTTATALSMVRGVLSVRPVVADPGQHIAEQRVRHEISKKLWDALFE